MIGCERNRNDIFFMVKVAKRSAFKFYSIMYFQLWIMESVLMSSEELMLLYLT